MRDDAQQRVRRITRAASAGAPTLNVRIGAGARATRYRALRVGCGPFPLCLCRHHRSLSAAEAATRLLRSGCSDSHTVEDPPVGQRIRMRLAIAGTVLAHDPIAHGREEAVYAACLTTTGARPHIARPECSA